MMFYVLGFLTGALSVVVTAFALTSKVRPKPVPRTWTSITSMEFEADFELDLNEGADVSDVAEIMLPAAIANAAPRLRENSAVGVDPGFYSVRLAATARFVKWSKKNDTKSDDALFAKVRR